MAKVASRFIITFIIIWNFITIKIATALTCYHCNLIDIKDCAYMLCPDDKICIYSFMVNPKICDSRGCRPKADEKTAIYQYCADRFVGRKMNECWKSNELELAIGVVKSETGVNCQCDVDYCNGEETIDPVLKQLKSPSTSGVQTLKLTPVQPTPVELQEEEPNKAALVMPHLITIILAFISYKFFS